MNSSDSSTDILGDRNSCDFGLAMRLLCVMAFCFDHKIDRRGATRPKPKPKPKPCLGVQYMTSSPSAPLTPQ